MTASRYRALNPQGKLVRGVLEGDSERQVRSQLRGQSLRPVVVACAFNKGDRPRQCAPFPTCDCCCQFSNIHSFPSR